MQIVGEWFLCDDGVPRPTVQAAVLGADPQPVGERFLVDCCADRTVLSAGLLSVLGLPVQPPIAGLTLQGISGQCAFVEFTAVLEFTTVEGGPARVRGSLAAFTDAAATDLSILGRDVLNNFDVIISRRRNEILLLAPAHHYYVARLSS